ncbi:hypothetical protein GX618_00225 [Candidatus Dojkabacteria bacterium]|uniref:Uncharacterized protein n=1 Tax=Candidatus Dojkabacteria bacterium TaxID=2099670 RepID=A0A847ESA3_9BACT|nr:hypothetical protein [Candidatus Dojkabacteria bacterium]
MGKKGFKIFTLILFSFVFVLIFFSFLNQTEAGCRDYCCGGQDGLGAPNPGPGETSNKSTACSGSGSTRNAGRCGVANCVEIPPEKGYCYPWAEQTWQYCCTPYYQICKPDGPVCGNSKLDGDEECDPPDSSCTHDSKAGVCTSGCECCTACSVSCPSPLVSSAPVNPPHSLSEYFYDNIDSCTDRNVCTNPQTRYADCYEVLSPQPTVSLVKLPEGVSTYLGFVSTNHTGGGGYETDALGVTKDNTVNDFYPYSSERYPDSNNLFYMEATFTDGDNPIESTYVWFNKSGIKPITPMYIDLNNDTTPLRYGTQNKEEFGFLLHHNLGVWTPYIPAISGDGDNTGDLWKKATSANGYSQVVEGKTILSIPTVPGANGIISKVLIDSVSYSDNGKKVIIRFSVSFKDTNTSLLSNRPNEGNYKIWLMGNDTFGFTPYDNYEDKAAIVKTAIHNRWITNERIRYYDQWNNTSQSWNLNFLNPQSTLSLNPVGGSDIEMNWTFSGNLPDEFSALVINVYRSEALSIDPVTLTIGSKVYSIEPEPLGDIGSRRIGSLNSDEEQYLLKLQDGTGNGSGILTLNDVTQGQLYFYLTVFDKGGNIGATGRIELDLRDWLITQGGLLYSNSIDINVEHGTTAPTGWDKVKIDFANADLSTELIGHQGSLPVDPYRKLIGSYVIKPYSIPIPIDSYYSSLLERFNRKRRFIQGLKNLGNIGSISGNLSDKGVSETEIAVVERDGTFTVSDNFNCNRQGVFFVSGNLTIEGKIANDNINKDACIFIVGGEVTIGDGTPLFGNILEYDEINAYILSDKKILVAKDEEDFNGLYISGGIHSLSNPGVVFQRSLKVADRLRFPALVVNHHSKYGMLAGRLFGNERIVQSTEVGLKPY